MTWHPDIPLEYRNQIVTGDARELAKRIPDESIDLIFTDPPYPHEYIDCYSMLSEMAQRVLRNKGLLFCYSGQSFLPEVINRLCEHMEYRWTISLLHGSSQIVWGKRAIAGWKPILVYSKNGLGDDTLIHDVVQPTHRDKRFHKWGQSSVEAIKYIDKFTEREGVILEPFCGGGSTIEAAKILSRNYIAFEIDPETADLARERVLNTQPPLFVPEPEQLKLRNT